MTDLSQMLRWNTGFVRGLAETVLKRAKVIRSSLNPYQAATPAVKKAKAKQPAAKTPRRRTAKTTVRKGKKASSLKQ